MKDPLKDLDELIAWLTAFIQKEIAAGTSNDALERCRHELCEMQRIRLLLTPPKPLVWIVLKDGTAECLEVR